MTATKTLKERALTGLIRMQVALAALIFIPAFSLTFWQGWLYWFVVLANSLATTLYLLRHDTALVERRLKAGPRAERDPGQKLIQALAAILIFAIIFVSSLDHLFGWSSVSWPIVIASEGLVILGFVTVFRVFRENSFASATIEVNVDQNVVSTGPYALVRHPMYAGALLSMFATPPALGSWWGLLPAGLILGVLVWRLLAEEKYLDRNLPGYEEYRRKVRWRLLPLVW